MSICRSQEVKGFLEKRLHLLLRLLVFWLVCLLVLALGGWELASMRLWGALIANGFRVVLEV